MFLTRRRHHALPLLKQRSLEAVTWAETVGLVSRHELLHWLQYHTQLHTTNNHAAALNTDQILKH